MTIGTIACRDQPPAGTPCGLVDDRMCSASDDDLPEAAVAPVIDVVLPDVSAALVGAQLESVEVTTTEMAPAEGCRSAPLTLKLAGPPTPTLLPGCASVPSLSVELVKSFQLAPAAIRLR